MTMEGLLRGETFCTTFDEQVVELKLTNLEVCVMFEQMIGSWFEGCRRVNNAFLQSLMADDVKAMNMWKEGTYWKSRLKQQGQFWMRASELLFVLYSVFRRGIRFYSLPG